MVKEKILIVDDEKPINDLIRSYVEKEGYQAFTAFSGAEAMEKARQETPDLIILDVMLPDTEGTALCMEIRKISQAPILFLSCKSQEIDKIIALSVGGDDYITKPFMGGGACSKDQGPPSPAKGHGEPGSGTGAGPGLRFSGTLDRHHYPGNFGRRQKNQSHRQGV